MHRRPIPDDRIAKTPTMRRWHAATRALHGCQTECGRVLPTSALIRHVTDVDPGDVCAVCWRALADDGTRSPTPRRR